MFSTVAGAHVRVHPEPRDTLSDPTESVGSLSAGEFTNERMAEVVYSDGTIEFSQDAWSEPSSA
eukprot:4686384-Pyramimonas_sp.AAC.1